MDIIIFIIFPVAFFRLCFSVSDTCKGIFLLIMGSVLPKILPLTLTFLMELLLVLHFKHRVFPAFHIWSSVNILWILYIMSMSLLQWGVQNWIQLSRCGLASAK